MIFLWSSAPSECNKSRKSNYETRFDVARDRWSVFFWVNSGRTLNNRNFASHGAAKSTFYCFLNLVHFRPVFEICFFVEKIDPLPDFSESVSSMMTGKVSSFSEISSLSWIDFGSEEWFEISETSARVSRRFLSNSFSAFSSAIEEAFLMILLNTWFTIGRRAASCPILGTPCPKWQKLGTKPPGFSLNSKFSNRAQNWREASNNFFWT